MKEVILGFLEGLKTRDQSYLGFVRVRPVFSVSFGLGHVAISRQNKLKCA